MSLYSRVERRMWRDEKFRALSAPAPNAQTLWQYLLTGPHNTPIPGLFVLGMATIADELNWSLEATKACFQEITAAGMARFDQATRLVWLPNALRSNKPGNPNVVVGWREEWALLPDCALKREAAEFFGGFLVRMSPEFARSFAIVQGKAKPRKSNNPSGKAKPKPLVEPLGTLCSQEQEQEQEQEERDLGRARDLGAPCAVPKPSPPSPPQEPPALPVPEPAPTRAPAAPPAAHCPRQEHAYAFDPTEALYALRAASEGGRRGQLGAMASAAQLAELAEVARSATPRPLTAEDFKVLGAAWKAGKALTWMVKPPCVGQLLRAGGEMLMTAMEEALSWNASQQKQLAAVRLVPTEPPAQPAAPEDWRRLRDAMTALKAGKTKVAHGS